MKQNSRHSLSVKPLQKPLLRGWFHQESFFVALGAGIMLVLKGSSDTAIFAALVYVIGLLLLFGVSATYHRPQWQQKQRAFMKRLDHSAIFIFIAGSMTPIALLGLPQSEGEHLLTVIWIVTLAGTLQSVFWVKAPKWVTALLYVIAGWLIFPYMPQLQVSLSPVDVGLIMAGGIVYTVGAVFYALKRPQLRIEIFGYHELFHVLTVIAAALHFAVIYKLIK